MSCNCEIEVEDDGQKGVLIALLGINALMFLVEVAVGVTAESTGLIADGLDMLADATVYGISLYAVGRAIRHKVAAARISGYLQVFLGLAVIIDVARRFIVGSEPESWWMIGIGLLALLANTVCLVLMARYRDGEIHMRASWIFSRNDVLANVGVITAGVLVAVLSSPIPDLLIGALVAAIVVSGGIRIIREARKEAQEMQA